MKNIRFRLLSFFFALGMILGVFSEAKGQLSFDFTVNTTADEDDAVIGDAVCSTTGGQCSLRAALQEGNSHFGFQTIIHLPGGTYVLSKGTLDISESATIIGEGQSTPTIQLGVGRIISITRNGITVSILGVTMENATLAAEGVGIRNNGSNLTVERVTIRGNTAFGGNGAGIFNTNGGSLTILQSTISGNTSNSGGNGGGVFSDSGTVTISNSTISSNSANNGGGLHMEGGNAVINNSTFSANSANLGGNISNSGGTVTLRNTIVADSPTGGNCTGILTSQGSNLENGATCGFSSVGDLTGLDPLLGSLQNNGGTTETHAITNGSPAFDAGDASSCLSTDQRGIARPQGNSCDIGSFELVVAPGGGGGGCSLVKDHHR